MCPNHSTHSHWMYTQIHCIEFQRRLSMEKIIISDRYCYYQMLEQLFNFLPWSFLFSSEWRKIVENEDPRYSSSKLPLPLAELHLKPGHDNKRTKYTKCTHGEILHCSRQFHGSCSDFRLINCLSTAAFLYMT